MKNTRRLLIIVALLTMGLAVAGCVIASFGLIGDHSPTVIIADGAYPLSVTIRSSGHQRIASIVVAPEGREPGAEEILAVLMDPQVDGLSLQRLIRIDMLCPVQKDPYRGEDLTVHVPFSERIRSTFSGFGPD
jgi:hypothetical protein